MSCEYRIEELKLCTILDIECEHPEENDPEQYTEETGFPCICGMFSKDK